MNNKLSKEDGFTLIELMITLAVFGIVSALAAPNISSFMRNNRLGTQTNEFISALHITRSEAVKRGEVITLCISDGNATPNCDSASTSWEDGWIIFTDLNGDASFSSASEDLIRIHEKLTDDNTLTSTHLEGVAYNIQFTPTGLLRARDAVSTTSPERTFTLCDSYTGNQLRAKGININKLGSISLAVDTDASNIVNSTTSAGDADVTCPAATK